MIEQDGLLWGKNAVAIRPGKVDRSPDRHRLLDPDGVLHTQGRIRVGARFVGTSILDTGFHCRLDAETELGGKPAIVPVISGRAWVMARIS